MGAPAPCPDYDVAKAFMCAWRSAVARGQIAKGGLVQTGLSGETGVLIVSVRYMPPGAFDPRFLLYGPGHATPLFSPLGDDWWLETHRLAIMAAQGADQRDGMAFLLLHPEAIEAARARSTTTDGVAA